MKSPVLVVAAVNVLLVAGCARAPDPAGEQRIAALEQKIETLERKADDLALKGRIVSSQVFGTPVENFLSADGWWENPYDSGQVDCARACIAAAATHRAECAKKKDDAERLTCYQEASDNAANCQRQCSRFPPPQ